MSVGHLDHVLIVLVPCVAASCILLAMFGKRSTWCYLQWFRKSRW